MLLPFLIAAALTSSPTTEGLVSTQQQQTSAAAQEPGRPVQLEDIEVQGRRLQDMVTDFVSEVAEPISGRGLARWQTAVCVGVANLRTETAQYIVDRISTVAEDLNLAPGAPGCAPNLLIVATADSAGLARTMIQERPRAFRMGGSGMDRGRSALRDFVETKRPVRWWQMSAPVDSRSGELAIRIPGECQNSCSSPMDYAPQILVMSPSRLNTQIVDRILRTIVIVDIDEVADLDVNQLADYIAMVSLAQIDPDADTSSYASILNVFEFPDEVRQLTDWDKAYLGGLYKAERTRLDRRAHRGEIVASIIRSRNRIAESRAGQDLAEH